jgi:molybdopterin converting factor small subunit
LKNIRIQVRFFALLGEAFDTSQLEAVLPEGADLRLLLEKLGSTPGRREILFKKDRLHPHLAVLQNGTGVVGGTGLDTRLSDEDVIAIFPLMGGG